MLVLIAAITGAGAVAQACINNPFNDKPTISVDGDWIGVDSAGDTLSLTLRSTTTTSSSYELWGSARHAPAAGSARAFAITHGFYNHDVFTGDDLLKIEVASPDSIHGELTCYVRQAGRLDASYWLSSFIVYRHIMLIRR